MYCVTQICDFGMSSETFEETSLFFLIFKFHGGGWVLVGFSHFNAILVIENAPLCSTIPNSSIQSILKIQLVEEANQLFGSADHFLVKVG